MRSSIERVLNRHIRISQPAVIKKLAIEIEAVLEYEGWIKMEQWIMKNESDHPAHIYESPDNGKTIYRREFDGIEKQKVKG